MKTHLLLFVILMMNFSILQSQHLTKTKCLSNMFSKERIELASQPRLSKREQVEIQSHVVGDSLEFWVYKHPWAKINTVCKAVGDNSYIFVEEEMWNLGFVDQSDINSVLRSFEIQTLKDSTKGIYQTSIENFGPVPNSLDGDEKIYILFYDLSVYGDGAFFAFDQYTQEQIDSMYGPGLYYSNEKEILYMNAKNDVSSNLMLSVVAHEFQHMIHWNMDPDEESWINEGCGEYAMFLYGYPDPIVIFNLYPDNDLTMWDSGFADYIQSYLFILYLYENYGGAETIKSLLAEPRNGIDGVDQLLQRQTFQSSFREVFSDWVIANYLDDTNAYSGEYGYRNEELPMFEASRSHSQYPIEQVTGTVSPWAADYIWMNNGSPQTFSFDGNDDGIFNVSVIKIDTLSQVTIDEITLDAGQNGIYDMSDFDDRWKQVVFAISNQKSFGSGTYSYSSSLITEVNEELNLPNAFSISQNYPNPFNPSTKIKYSIPQQSSVTLKVFDVLGREVTTLVNKEQPQGNYEVEWNASEFSSGIYFYKINAGNLAKGAVQVFVEIKKMLLIK